MPSAFPQVVSQSLSLYLELGDWRLDQLPSEFQVLSCLQLPSGGITGPAWIFIWLPDI